METPQEHQGTCITCGPRDADEGQLVCGPCATRIRHRLRDLSELHAELGQVREADDDWTDTTVKDATDRPVRATISDDGKRITDGSGKVLHHRDPGLPAANLRGRSIQPHVSGSPDPSTPIDLQAVDLDGQVVRLGGIPVPDHATVHPGDLVPLMRIVNTPVRIWVGGVLHEQPIRRREAVRNAKGRRILVPAIDEVGARPIAVRLDEHVRRWIDLRGRREHRPIPKVGSILGWLGARLDWALKHDVDLWRLDSDVRHMIAQVKGVLGLHDAQPVRYEGIPCRRCDNVGTLVRVSGDPYIECTHPDCSDLMTDDEYKRYTVWLADREKAKRTRAELRALRRPKPAEGAA